jgi:hypothetical protein
VVPGSNCVDFHAPEGRRCLLWGEPGAGWFGACFGFFFRELRESVPDARLVSGLDSSADGCGRGTDGKGEEGVGDAIGGVAENVTFRGEVAGDALDAEGLDAVDIGNGSFGALGGITLAELAGDGGGVDEGVIEDGSAGVLVDALNVLGGGEVKAFVGLGHEIADEHAGGPGVAEGFRNAMDEEVGDDAGVKGAGADGDKVGGSDGLEGFGRRGWIGRVEHELDDALAAGGDVGFAADDGAVFHAGCDGDVGGSYREDVATGGEDFRGELDGLGEVAGHFGEGGDEEIAEVVAAELTGALKAVTEEAGDQAFVFREGDHAVTKVARGEHVEVTAKAAAGAAVVGDGDYRGEVGDVGDECRLGDKAGAVRYADLEAAQKGGEAGSPADSDDAQAGRRGRCRGYKAHRIEQGLTRTSLNQRGEERPVNWFRDRGVR